MTAHIGARPLQITVLSDEMRTPSHLITVDISGQRRQAWNLVSIDGENHAERNILVFNSPKEVVTLLRPEVKVEWDLFCHKLGEYRRNWRIGGVPAFKRSDRQYRNHKILQDFELATIVHHFGAVPALVVGRADRFRVALFAENDGDGTRPDRYSDAECWELLQSLERYLPHLLPAYYEQIANYLHAVFFGGQDRMVMPSCQRIRQIARASIRDKMDSIEQPRFPQENSGKLARQLAKKFQDEIRVAHAVDAVAHLIVNYIYRFYCIQDRIPDYHGRLASIPSSRTLFSTDPVCFMQECAKNMEQPSDEFRKQLESGKNSRDQWLQAIGEMSAFVAEIVRSVNGKRFDVPKVFVTYHCKVKESERFIDLATKTVQSPDFGAVGELVLGRHIQREIRWPILARIWMADHHLLFLPSTWERVDQKLKSLRTEKNWVVMELFYGRLLGRDMSLVVPSRSVDSALDQFRAHINGYTEEKEIPYVAEMGWRTFVHRTKQEIIDLCHNTHRLEFDLEGLEASDFAGQFKEHIIQRAARNLIKALFDAWCYFFEAEKWSVAQALILLHRENQQGSYRIKRVADFVQRQARSNLAFQWEYRYPTEKSLEEAIRNHLGNIDEPGLRKFAFILEDQKFYPIVATRVGLTLEIKVRTQELYARLCSQFGISPSVAEYEEIVRALLAPRPRD